MAEYQPTHRQLSDAQYLAIQELRDIETDIQLRLSNLIRESGHDVRYNTRALEYAQMEFEAAFMWAKKGVANEGIGRHVNV